MSTEDEKRREEIRDRLFAKPAPKPEGWCVHCKEETVIPRFLFEPFTVHTSTGEERVQERDGCVCTKCGLRYDFAPSEEVAKK